MDTTVGYRVLKEVKMLQASRRSFLKGLLAVIGITIDATRKPTEFTHGMNG
jgi:hypothetical protein